MKSLLPSLATGILVALLSPSAEAQQNRFERPQTAVEKPERFPVLRKAFRYIRDDVRYHAGALRASAKDLRHDVGRTIRGGKSKTAHNQYGYRAAEPGRGTSGKAQDTYEEPAPARQSPSPSQRPPVDEASLPEPKIVAPKELSPAASPEPTSLEEASEPGAEPKPQRSSDRDTNSEKKDSKSDPDPKSVMGKVAYPAAKRSSRPGFHHSPYPPYELLDTQGIEPGELAKDPGNGKIFRIPK